MRKTLRGVACVLCRELGHRCQAQMWDGDSPVCLACGDGEACVAQRLPVPRIEDEGVFCVRVPAQPRREGPVQGLRLSLQEQGQMRRELLQTSAAQVARRHHLPEEAVVQCLRSDAAKMPRRLRGAQVRPARLGRVVAVVSQLLAVAPSEMCGSSHKAAVTRARQIGMYIATVRLQYSLTRTGRFFSRHHTSVLYAREIIAEGIKRDNGLRNTVEAVWMRLQDVEQDCGANFPQIAREENLTIMGSELAPAS